MALQNTFKLEYDTGDVVEKVEDGGVLVHACNCIGAWGSGIALQLKQQFPAAFEVFRAYCKDRTPDQLINTSLLIPPQDLEPNSHGSRRLSRKSVWIACLFTSLGYGRKNAKMGNPGLSPKADVIVATKKALEDLRGQLSELSLQEGKDSGKLGSVASVRFNSGSFKVPWEETARLIEEVFGDTENRWVVVSGGG